MFTMMFLSWIAGIITQILFAKYAWPYRHRTYTWIFKFRDHRAVGEPCETDLVLDREGFSLGYSYKRKSALWVSYIISKHSIGIDHPRSNSFFADPEIPYKYRVLPEEFDNSGYDRGHLVPSASVDFSRKSNKQTFSMANVVAQDPVLNRQAWGYLESVIRRWTVSKGKLAIVAGPIYGQRNKRVGDVWAPRQLYKAIYAYDSGKCIAFLFPNKEVTNKQLWKYACSLHQLEEETGYTFFAHLKVSEISKKAFDVTWWKQKEDD